MTFERVLFAGLACAVLAATPAEADLKNWVQICSDARAQPADVVNFCRKALDSGSLSQRAEAQVRTNLGAGLADLQRFDEAVDEYTQAIALAPGLMAAYLNRARALERQNRLQDAADDYAEILRRDPNAAEAYLARGAMLLRNGDPARAVADLSAAIQIEPAWNAPYFNRGVAYLRLEDYGKASQDFTKVIRNNPDDAGAFLNRGRARAGLGTPDARGDFDRAIELEPEWGGAWFARGRFHDDQGNREAANADFIRANELGYPDPWLIQRMREISG